MYKMPYIPCDGTVAREIVTEVLKDWFLCMFGPTDGNGTFQDPERFRELILCTEFWRIRFAIENGACDDATGEIDGLIRMLKMRCEDIYAKLCDKEHEYAFDVFGKTILAMMMEFSRSDIFYNNTGSLPWNENRFRGTVVQDDGECDPIVKDLFPREYTVYSYLSLRDRGCYDDEFLDRLGKSLREFAAAQYAERFGGRKDMPMYTEREKGFVYAYEFLMGEKLFDIRCYGLDYNDIDGVYLGGSTLMMLTDELIDGEVDIDEDESFLDDLLSKSLIFEEELGPVPKEYLGVGKCHGIPEEIAECLSEMRDCYKCGNRFMADIKDTRYNI